MTWRSKLKDFQYATVVRWLIVISIPLVLTLFTLRLMISWNSPSYPSFEYSRIAPDQYGFTPEERLRLAEDSQDFLRHSEPAEEVVHLISDLRLPGTNKPLYNQREIGHLVDVKNVMDSFRTLLWILGIGVVAGLVLLLARPETRPDGFKAIMHGGILTMAILLAMILLLFVAWNVVFTQFHEILFTPGTWTFFYTDSLIRLFPEQFWFDFGLLWTVGIFLQGAILAAVGYFLMRSASR
jgi:integral membrane protein (TIGR01906 family)